MLQNLINMRYLKTLAFVLFSIVVFSSCKKDNSPTQGQIMAAKLRYDIGVATINGVYVYDFSSGNLRSRGTSVEINGDGTVNVMTEGTNPTNISYNLETLVTYSIVNGNLDLYF